MASAGYKNDQEKKQNTTAEQTDNISPRGFRHENENTAYFWINSALEATNWSHILSVSLQMSWLPSPKDFAPILSK